MKYFRSIVGAFTVTLALAAQAQIQYYNYTTNLGNGIRNIGLAVFEDCTSLTEIRIPSSVTSIGDGAFGGCSGLANITIPDSVTTIGNGTFELCGLTNVVIGSGVVSMLYSFDNCSHLGSIYFKGNAPSVDSDGFSGDL